MILRRGQQVYILHFLSSGKWRTGIYHHESGGWLVKGIGRFYWQHDRWAQVCGSDYSGAAVICQMCGLSIIGERWLEGNEFPTPYVRKWLTESGKPIPELLTQKPMSGPTTSDIQEEVEITIAHHKGRRKNMLIARHKPTGNWVQIGSSEDLGWAAEFLLGIQERDAK